MHNHQMRHSCCLAVLLAIVCYWPVLFVNGCAPIHVVPVSTTTTTTIEPTETTTTTSTSTAPTTTSTTSAVSSTTTSASTSTTTTTQSTTTTNPTSTTTTTTTTTEPTTTTTTTTETTPTTTTTTTTEPTTTTTTTTTTPPPIRRSKMRRAAIVANANGVAAPVFGKLSVRLDTTFPYGARLAQNNGNLLKLVAKLQSAIPPSAIPPLASFGAFSKRYERSEDGHLTVMMASPRADIRKCAQFERLADKVMASAAKEMLRTIEITCGDGPTMRLKPQQQ